MAALLLLVIFGFVAYWVYAYIKTAEPRYLFMILRVFEVAFIIVLPLLYLSMQDFDKVNDCCSDSAVFSPKHRISVYALILLCTAAYFLASFKRGIYPPVTEVFINIFLLIGIVLNVVILIHIKDLGWIGNSGIIILFVIALVRQENSLIAYTKDFVVEQRNIWEKIAWKILNAPFWVEYPILVVLALPVLMLITSVLLLFGQEPDSMVKAFTETYKHGLSQIDYMCKDVVCGDGHFLCTVAANGHKNFVKPQRLGKRIGMTIICNRQLLVANAFEELIAERFPRFHKIIRRNYNKVGRKIHKHYHFFQNKYLSDLIYLLMKPLEWLFLLTLYTFDQKPENRIARQYV